ncbi:hypothetical protein Gotri_022659 [Gossypium trilobum]|uniref:Uncharacterized protein n=1 Tax=Gossypium trilobum TaxID=34281 RepID=A0A7J9DGH2_9ROSI|nr:hypothetical protein [Gossypium trilobum]
MAKALELDEKEMMEYFEDGMQPIKMTYYPPCPQLDLVMGITLTSIPLFTPFFSNLIVLMAFTFTKKMFGSPLISSQMPLSSILGIF